MADKFEQKPNTSFCFKKDGFDGYSGQIKLEDGQEFFVNVYENDGKKGKYMNVKLKPKVKNNDPQSPNYGERNNDVVTEDVEW